MGNVAVRLAVRRPGPGRVELREGGGWLAVFGLLFAAFGVLAILAAVGAVEFEDRVSGDHPWLLPAFGAAFTAVGLAFVLGRG